MMIDSEFQERARTKARETLDKMREKDPERYATALRDPDAFVEGFVRGVDALTRLQVRRSLCRPGEVLDGDWLAEGAE